MVIPVLPSLPGAGTRCLSGVWLQSPALHCLPHFSPQRFCRCSDVTETHGWWCSCFPRLNIWTREDGLASSGVQLMSVSGPLVCCTLL